MQLADANSQWRQHRINAAAAPPDIRIAIAGSMTVEPLTPYLGSCLLGRAFKNPHIVTSPFGQILQICRNYKSFFSEEPDILILLWRIEDMFPDLIENPPALIEAIAMLAEAVSDLRKNFKGTLVVSAPPYPSTAMFDMTDLEQPVIGAMLYHRASEAWVRRMMEITQIHIIDLGALERKVGADAIHDSRKWFLYRQPWAEKFWSVIGRQLGRMISSQTRSPKKCIVVDADNTLWGGIIGEDGLGGIALGEDFPGSAYRAFQKHLLHLKKKGVLLAIASKNNESDFFEVLDKHDAMVLKRSDIAAFQIHWNSKVDSIRQIAQTLNIGTETMVFIDDSLKEITEVQERLPEVICLQVPEEVAALPALLVDCDLFDFADVTDEDRHRTDMIVTERTRSGLRETLSEADFKASLELVMTVFDARRHHIARVTQLINKTNQFNLTTIRRTQDEVEVLARSPRHRVIGMELKDKYGDYGLTGVAILEKKGEACVIDTLLMSCRILGRDAETAFISLLAAQAAAMGCDAITGQYLPTAKNALVKDLYQKHGMTYNAAQDMWSVPVALVTQVPAYIRVIKVFGKDD